MQRGKNHQYGKSDSTKLIIKVMIQLRTRQPFILILRHLAFSTLECLDFHTKTTATYTQQVFEKYVTILFQRDVSFVPAQYFIQNSSQERFRILCVPHTWNFSCIKSRKSLDQNRMN